MVTSLNRGHKIMFTEKGWIDCKTGFAFSDNVPCSSCGKVPGDSGIDPCLDNIIKALNNNGIETVASCCGHGRQPGSIILKDGREIIIVRDFKTAREVEKKLQYPGITHTTHKADQ